MVNREEVARLSGVSPMTVTRVVSGKGYVAETTRKKVQKVIEEVGYIPNKVASNLVSRRSNKIAIIVPELNNPYYLQVVEAMIKEAKKYNYILSIFKANAEELPGVLEEAVSNRVAGIVNYTVQFPIRYINYLKEIGAKLIRADNADSDFRMKLSYDAAIKSAVDLLIGKGARKILFVSGMSEKFTLNDRRVPFFIRYMEKIGLKVRESDIIYGDYPREEAYIVGYNSALKLLQKGEAFDAAFCMNDMMAFGFMNAMKRGGKKIPDDVAVVGFDNIRMSEVFEPALSTVAIDIEKEARLYVNYIAGVQTGENIDLDAKFIPRHSTDFRGILN